MRARSHYHRNKWVKLYSDQNTVESIQSNNIAREDLYALTPGTSCATAAQHPHPRTLGSPLHHPSPDDGSHKLSMILHPSCYGFILIFSSSWGCSADVPIETSASASRRPAAMHLRRVQYIYTVVRTTSLGAAQTGNGATQKASGICFISLSIQYLAANASFLCYRFTCFSFKIDIHSSPELRATA